MVTNLNKPCTSNGCAPAVHSRRGGALNNICKDEAVIDLAEHYACILLIVSGIQTEIGVLSNIIMLGA